MQVTNIYGGMIEVFFQVVFAAMVFRFIWMWLLK